jgi:hypothetical protein
MNNIFSIEDFNNLLHQNMTGEHLAFLKYYNLTHHRNGVRCQHCQADMSIIKYFKNRADNYWWRCPTRGCRPFKNNQRWFIFRWP